MAKTKKTIEKTAENAVIIYPSIAVDAACSGNPGMMEYRGVDTATKKQIFHFGPIHGTNNIGEFLAIVHALALSTQKGSNLPIYSDSTNALTWLKNKKCKTTLKPAPENEKALELVRRAELWLQTHPYTNKVLKWETARWGEIPADFGRKNK